MNQTEIERLANAYVEKMRGTPKDRRIAYADGYSDGYTAAKDKGVGMKWTDEDMRKCWDIAAASADTQNGVYYNAPSKEEYFKSLESLSPSSPVAEDCIAVGFAEEGRKIGTFIYDHEQQKETYIPHIGKDAIDLSISELLWFYNEGNFNSDNSIKEVLTAFLQHKLSPEYKAITNQPLPDGGKIDLENDLRARIAMAFYDEYNSQLEKSKLMTIGDSSNPEKKLNIHEIANSAAKRFLEILCHQPKDESPSPSSAVADKEKLKELVEATLIIGARRGAGVGVLTHDTAKELIQQDIEGMTDRFIKLEKQTL